LRLFNFRTFGELPNLKWDRVECALWGYALKWLWVFLSRALAGLLLFGCAARTTLPTVPQRTNAKSIPSCFPEGDRQTSICKSEVPNDAGKVVVTLCIGSQNLQANPELRGKCVEKTCSPNSNTDCKVRGRIGVFQQYAELASANLFDADDAGKKSHSMKAVEPPDPAKVEAEPPAPGGPAEASTVKGASTVPRADAAVLPKVPLRKNLSKSGKGMSLKSAPSGWPKAASSVGWPTAPERATSFKTPGRAASLKTRERTTSSKTIVQTSAPVRESGEAMKLVLRPARSSRTPASVAAGNASKRVCVAKSNMTAPANLRGKCAVRTCLKGKCNYQGQKDMFDRISAQASGDELLD
jgi:hypothetical protein